jgi:hypothetical protein
VRTVLIPCAREGNAVIVIDAERRKHPIPVKADPEFAAFDDGRMGVIVDLFAREGQRLHVRIPGGAVCWVPEPRAA